MSIESFPYTIFSEDWWYDETEEGRMNTCSEVLEYFRNTPNLEELPLSFDANLTSIQNLSAIRYGIGTMLEALNEGEMVAVVHCIPMDGSPDANFGVIVFDGTQNEPFWNHFGITVWDGEVIMISAKRESGFPRISIKHFSTAKVITTCTKTIQGITSSAPLKKRIFSIL